MGNFELYILPLSIADILGILGFMMASFSLWINFQEKKYKKRGNIKVEIDNVYKILTGENSMNLVYTLRITNKSLDARIVKDIEYRGGEKLSHQIKRPLSQFDGFVGKFKNFTLEKGKPYEDERFIRLNYHDTKIKFQPVVRDTMDIIHKGKKFKITLNDLPTNLSSNITSNQSLP